MRAGIGRRPVPPLGLVLALLFVGLARLISLAALARFPANPVHPLNAGSFYLFWEFWFGRHGGLAPVLQSMMGVNALLVVFLWLQFRGLPRGSLRARSLRLLAYGGAAVLLAYLQYGLAVLATVEPAIRLIRLDPGTGVLSVP